MGQLEASVNNDQKVLIRKQFIQKLKTKMKQIEHRLQQINHKPSSYQKIPIQQPQPHPQPQPQSQAVKQKIEGSLISLLAAVRKKRSQVEHYIGDLRTVMDGLAEQEKEKSEKEKEKETRQEELEEIEMPRINLITCQQRSENEFRKTVNNNSLQQLLAIKKGIINFSKASYTLSYSITTSSSGTNSQNQGQSTKSQKSFDNEFNVLISSTNDHYEEQNYDNENVESFGLLGPTYSDNKCHHNLDHNNSIRQQSQPQHNQNRTKRIKYYTNILNQHKQNNISFGKESIGLNHHFYLQKVVKKQKQKQQNGARVSKDARKCVYPFQVMIQSRRKL